MKTYQFTDAHWADFGTRRFRPRSICRALLIVVIMMVPDARNDVMATTFAGAEVESTKFRSVVKKKARPNGQVNTGFLVTRDGFSFSNWGGLTPEDALTFANMARLFGSRGTCFEDPAQASCTLRSGQRLDLSTVNSYVAYGRCEGMTVLAARLFANPAEISSFDSNAKTTHELTKAATARELAYVSMTQLLPEIQGFAARTKMKKPFVLAKEIEFQLRRKRFVSMGIYGEGFGHSVVPFAVKYTPRATTFSVYDPNFPDEVRTLKVDHLRGAWFYDNAVLADGSTGPVTWTGAGRLDYVPINLRYDTK